MRRGRVVLDTNVFVSGFLNPDGIPSQVLHVTETSREWVFTQSTLSELLTVLMRSKFDRYATVDRRRKFILLVADLGKVVPVEQSIVACRDPRDNHILEAAVNGSAETIITGDKDLLDLNPFHGIRIVTPSEYLL